MDKNNLKKVFALYGYKLITETDRYIIYSDEHSMYPGVEIVCFSNDINDEILNLKQQFSQQDYAVRVCDPENAGHIEDYLFDWFFRVKNTNRSIKERYHQYGESVINSYGLSTKDNKPYCYIDVPYQVEYDLKETQTGYKNGLIKSIRQEIESKGPRLIIVEAAAGFGKTSTAMELLNSFSDVEHGIRPFYMELYKDRQAAVFRYLFLSQLHREFQVLMDDEIVNYNIEQGRIPLIIDGFDELLSEDLDKGNIIRAKKRGETMLSTIADLLRGNAKIVLTSRKTAILSGEDFIDWYQSKFEGNNEIHVTRYILDQPLLENWLSIQQIKLLGDKISGISNPVLLGYLHYLKQSDFVVEAKSSNLIESYVKRLLEREIDRQDLTLTVDEQKLVFEKLAAAFAYEDITSDTRSNIKDCLELLCSDIISPHATIQKDVASITNTLTNHALLDRKTNGTIGFVNDFVLGIFLGYAVIDEKDATLKEYYKNISSNFVEKLVNTITVSSEDIRESIWLQLHDNCPSISQEQKLMIDLRLMHRNMTEYKNLFFDGFHVDGITIGLENAGFEGCHFVNFQFENGTFNTDYIKDCTFINCVFNKSKFIGDKDTNDYFSCIRDGEEIKIDVEQEHNIDEFTLVPHNETDEWVSMLSYFFQVGERTRKMKLISKLKQEYNDNKSFKRVFSKLLSNAYVVSNGDKAHLTDAGASFYFNNKK